MQTIINIPFLKAHNEKIEFQVIDMETILKIKPAHDLEYPHRLDFNMIMVITQGSGTHSIDFKQYSYSKGSVFFIKRNQTHSFHLNPNLKCHLLQFSDNFLNRLYKDNLYDIFDYMRYTPTITLQNDLYLDIVNNIKLIKNKFNTSIDKLQESILQAFLLALLLQLKKVRFENCSVLSNQNQIIYQKFLTLVYHEHKYSQKVEDYSKKLNISIRTLSNILNKYTGKSTKKYLNEFLCLEIKRYLLDENLSLQELTIKLDFDEATNLIKFFKKYEKISPNEFKKNHIS